MINQTMAEQITHGRGFIAALDQSGGSTPGALRLYGIPDTAYSGEAEMFRLMHEMRVRIMTSPAFTGAQVLGAILFENTMDGEADGKPVPAFLWERGVVPFLKVDKGLEAETGRGQPDEADAGAGRAARAGGEARRLRHQDAFNDQPAFAGRYRRGREAAVRGRGTDRRPWADADHRAGSARSRAPTRPGPKRSCGRQILKHLDALPDGQQVMLKLTIPTVTDFYRELTQHAKVARVVALSGGYSRTEACRRLAANHGMIASFSRALAEGLQHSMSDADVRCRPGELDRRDLPGVYREGVTRPDPIFRGNRSTPLRA